jgi:phenylglyoxylate dehydrogenase epsilon subunit
MVGTGVTPVMGYLAGSGIATGRGILVDERMRTSDPNVWAAGDVAEVGGFFGDGVVNGILPGAVEQGRVAGADMVERDEKPYAGLVPLNTYHFFKHHSISVGIGGQLKSDPALEVKEDVDEDKGVYRRIVLKDGHL